MNANDYASILENQGHKYIADFVRQQQAEIEALKADCEQMQKTMEKYCDTTTHPAEPKELTVPENSQDWKGMDGATAFWLIERHSNHWDDARLMMEEWLKANTHPAKTLTDEEIYKIAMEVQTGFFPQDDTLEFARAILRKAQENG